MSDVVMNFTEQELISYIPNLRKYASALRRRREDIDDLLQDTLDRALRKRDLFVDQGKGSLLRWLRTMMHNLGASQRRQWHRESQVLAPWPNDVEDGSSALWGGGRGFDEVCAGPDSADVRVVISDLSRALASLPHEKQQVIQLVIIEGLSYDEAAAIAGVPVGTIRSRLSRGRVELRERLGR